MADPPYFRRLPIPLREPVGAARDRLGRQIEIHRRSRCAAKARAIAQGFPGITAETPVEDPFATWGEADICPIHRFMMAEIGHPIPAPPEVAVINQTHIHFDKGPPVAEIDVGLHAPTIMFGDSSASGHVRLGIYGVPRDRVAHLADVWNAILAGRRVEILPVDRDAEHAASSAGRLAAEIEGGDPLKIANRARHKEAAQAGDRARELEDARALS